MRVFRRRSQKDRLVWQQLGELCAKLGPETERRHPWPDWRFTVTHAR